MNNTLLERSPEGAQSTQQPAAGAGQVRSSRAKTVRLIIGLIVSVALVVLAAVLGQQALRGADSNGPSAGGSSGYSIEQAPIDGERDRDSTVRGPVGERAAPGTAETAQPPAAAEAGSIGKAPAVTPVESGQSIIRTAWLGIEVTALPEASTKVRAIAGTSGGRVVSEDVVTGENPTGLRPSTTRGNEAGRSVRRPGMNQASIVLAVPTDKLDSVLGQLSGIGKVSVRSQSSEDVTDSVIDTKARVATMTEGVNRLRALLAKATKLEDVITLEAELGRRQADLESMQGRLANLTERSAMAEINVSLWTPNADTPVVDEPSNAFIDGLKKAGQLLADSSLAILAGLAIMLPWLLLGLIGWLVVRRVLRRRAATAPDAAHSPQPAPAAAAAAATSATTAEPAEGEPKAKAGSDPKSTAAAPTKD